MNPQLQQFLAQAIQSFQSGNLEGASMMLKRILKVDPKNLPALNILGLIMAIQANYSDAITFFSKAAKLDPKNSATHFNLAKAFSDSGKDEQSLSHYKISVELSPQNAEVWLGYGKSLFNLGRYMEALTIYENALIIRPNYFDALINKGATLKELRHFEGALRCADEAIILDPASAEAWLNKGVALKELKRIEEALLCYENSLSLNPQLADALSNKGNLLRELKEYDNALKCYDEAIELRPDFAEPWLNKGALLKELGAYLDAKQCYEKAISLKPYMRWMYGDYFLLKLTIADFDGVIPGSDWLSQQILDGKKFSDPFPLLSLIDDPAIHKMAAQIYCKDKYPFNPLLESPIEYTKKEKIKIGYFSPDFRSHPVAYLTAGVFEMHDKAKFEIYAFSFRNPSSPDQMRDRLINSFDKFLDVENKSDLEIAKLARDLDIDIAIDIAGFTQGSRLGVFAHRAAPIQVGWLGYPGTIGSEYMDYIIADRIVIPEHSQKEYTEKVVYLPKTYIVDDFKRVPSRVIPTRKDCDLPESDFVFCCFNNGYKFNEQIVDRFSKILSAVSNSVLWIPENNNKFKINIQIEFESRGIDKSRIIFSKKIDSMADHLVRYSLADLFLDTSPYNAHTTALDALKSCVPIIALPGKSFASRVSASLLYSIDMKELIVDCENDFVELAIQLANNPVALNSIRNKLNDKIKEAPFFNTLQFTRDLEVVYKNLTDDLIEGVS